MRLGYPGTREHEKTRQRASLAGLGAFYDGVLPFSYDPGGIKEENEQNREEKINDEFNHFLPPFYTVRPAHHS